ncbi:MAG: bifunctional riboflavin kinase/FAD synthetase [Planctomycetota bacterium]
MDIVEATSGPAELVKVEKGCVLTIGNFDGVHLGHQEILIAARQIAAKRRAQLVVMTFEPHPLAVLHPEKRPGILTSLALKKHLIAQFGVDSLLVLKSTLELLRFSPEDFVERFIVNNIQPSVVVEGESFNFGCGRGGGIRTLQELGAEKGFEVSVIGAKEVELSTGQTVTISSTLIRNMLESGSVADAALALSRPYRLIGRIIPGRDKGKQLGFPTANMEPPQQLVPAEGVYAGLVEIVDSEGEVCAAKEKVPAAFSIGRAETLGSANPLAIEAHILIDNVGDLHDKWLAMDFIKRLRDQQKFETETELAAQIAKDCENAKQLLGKEF